MATKWPEVAFDHVLVDVSAGQPKTKTRDFLHAGQYPLVDQGRELVGGYSDDPFCLSTVELPLVVFGDHTRAVKYVDFPFGVGADGVKLLRPRDGSDPAYLYRFLQSIEIPAAGYDRHFKYLKRISIPVPPIEEQRRIAVVLDQADALRAKRRESLDLLDSLAESMFLDLFGDPVVNPRGWPARTLGDVLTFQQYGHRFYDEPYSDDGVRTVRITDLNEAGELDFTEMPRMALTSDEQEKYVLRPGDLIFARSGATVGKVALIRPGDPPCIAGAYFITMRFDASIDPEYAKAVLRSTSIRALVEKRSRQAAQQNFSGPALRRLPLPVPPLRLQRQFADRLRSIAIRRTGYLESSTQLKDLFASLQQRAFRGDL